MKQVMRNNWIRYVALSSLLCAMTVFAEDKLEGQPEKGIRSPVVAPRTETQLTAREQIDQAKNYIEKMKASLFQSERLAERSRSEKDVLRLNCVNDKVIQMKGLMRLAEQLSDSLQIAASRSDDAARSHEFSKLTIIYQKVVVLHQEAEACAGEEIAYVGDTRVEIDVDPAITGADPTSEPAAPLVTERPPLASPFQ